MKTPVSLLERVRDTRDQEAWSRFVDLYYPLLCHWARQAGVPRDDIADFTQEVFAHLVQKLPSFQYDASRGSFRRWLYALALNKWRERLRKARLPTAAEATAEDLADEDRLVRLIDEEHTRFLVARSLQLMRSDCEEPTWQACWLAVVEDRPAAEVARQLGMSTGAVYTARSRVLHRLRTELKGLL